MEEHIRAQEELSLAEIIWILWRRIKFIVLALVVGLIAGAGIAALKTYDVHYYGTNAEFYVNPYKDSETSGDAESQYGVYGAYGRPVMDNMVKLLASDFFAEKIGLAENGYPLTGLSAEVDAIIASSATAQEAVDAWRETAHYKSWVSNVQSSVSYSYYQDASGDVDDLAKSFLYVKVSVLNNESFATFLFERIKALLPQFVSANMAVPSGYDGTNCRFISTASSIGLLNSGYAVKSAIKYGAIAGAAALVLACIAVIVIDRSDQRLRNYELVMERLQIPVLGVIPCIEEDMKKRAKAKAEVQK